MTTFTEHPPVPKVLQEALNEYPELIEDIKQSLTRCGLRPGMTREQRTDQFETAIARLECDLDHYFGLAAAEVRAAEAMGDVALIAKAKEKEMLLFGCRGGKLRKSYTELSDFFRVSQD